MLNECQVIYVDTSGNRHATEFYANEELANAVARFILHDKKGTIHKIWLQGRPRG